MEHTIAAEELEANCHSVLEEITGHSEPLVIMKEGRPVAMLVGVPEEAELCGGVPVSVLTVDEVVLPVEKWES